MPLPKLSSMSPAASDLGLGDMLNQQVKDETDEERKKRMAQMKLGGGAMESPANLALFGGVGGLTG